MNRKDIIRMAKESGVVSEAYDAGFMNLFTSKLIRFAALVASAEREACAIVCDDLWEDDGTAYECAEAIRARGQA